MSQTNQAFTNPSHGVQKAVAQLRPVQQKMFKRFDEILSVQQDFLHKVKEQRLYVDDMPDGEVSQFTAITNIMMENTVDYCGVKRGYL